MQKESSLIFIKSNSLGVNFFTSEAIFFIKLSKTYEPIKIHSKQKSFANCNNNC